MQMRMLSRVISDLMSDVMPLPRLWYFPNAKKTLLIVTSDGHVTDPTAYQTIASSAEARGARLSFYISRFISLPSATVAAWRASGHEVGLHPFGAADGVSLTQGYQTAQNWFASQGWGTPSPTVRNHQIEWQGWVDAATIEASRGLAMNLRDYTWAGCSIRRSPGAWIYQRVRFADALHRLDGCYRPGLPTSYLDRR